MNLSILQNKSKDIHEREQWLTSQLMNIAISIHRIIGPGLLESVYEKCFCYELSKRHISFIRQLPVPVIYNSMCIDDGLTIDLLIENAIIVQLKAQAIHNPLWESQMVSYLKLTGKRLGYIMNFHVPLMKDGIIRMAL